MKRVRWITWRRLALVGGVVLMALGGYVAFDNRERTPVLVAGVVLFGLGLLSDRLTELSLGKDGTVKMLFAAVQDRLGAVAEALAKVDAVDGIPEPAREELENARDTV